MKRLLDHDPLTGVTNYFHYDEHNDISTIETVQDVDGVLDMTQRVRNDNDATKKGIKGGWWHYAHLPDIVILKMIQEDGVNPYDLNDAKKVGQLVEDKYQYCKLTSGKHKFKA